MQIQNIAKYTSEDNKYFDINVVNDHYKNKNIGLEMASVNH